MSLDLLTPAETARQLRVSESTVRRWCRTGVIPSVKLGHERTGTVRIPAEGLAHLVAARSGSREVRG